jgi:uncharacterized protein
MDQNTINLVISEFQKALIANWLTVENIVLFGSQVTGKIHDGSDIDLIIVSNDFKGKDLFERCDMTLVAELMTRQKFIIPMDILTMTPAEYRESQSRKFFNSKIVA